MFCYSKKEKITWEERQLKEDTVWLKVDILEKFMIDTFLGIGVPEDEARILSLIHIFCCFYLLFLQVEHQFPAMY